MTINSVEELLAFEEGERFSAYQDSRGYWTIGVGHCIDARMGGRISPQISHFMLQEDIYAHETYLHHNFPWFDRLDEVRKAVLISMAHQLGGLHDWPKFINAMATQDYIGAADALLDSDVARNEAPARFGRAALMIRSGHWPDVTEST